MRMIGKAEVSANRIRLDRKKMELKGENPAELLAELQSLPGVATLNTQDFRRGGIKVKLAILGAAAALYDAGLEPSDRLGLTGWGADGSRTENLLYFQDYMEHGRCGGRGQLFGLLGGRFGLSRRMDIPRWMKSKWFRYGFLIFSRTSISGWRTAMAGSSCCTFRGPGVCAIR